MAGDLFRKGCLRPSKGEIFPRVSCVGVQGLGRANVALAAPFAMQRWFCVGWWGLRRCSHTLNCLSRLARE